MRYLSLLCLSYNEMRKYCETEEKTEYGHGKLPSDLFYQNHGDMCTITHDVEIERICSISSRKMFSV